MIAFAVGLTAGRAALHSPKRQGEIGPKVTTTALNGVDAVGVFVDGAAVTLPTDAEDATPAPGEPPVTTVTPVTEPTTSGSTRAGSAPSTTNPTNATSASPQPFVAVAPKAEALELLAGLTVAFPDPQRPTYLRDRFGNWADDDGDCRDTRAEVLAAESEIPVTGRCTITAGRWYSAYDDTELDDPQQVDVDHLVPLGNAWDSGAWRWSADRLVAYGNDVEHVEHLVAVSSRSNRSKGDRSPDRWMIPSRDQPTRCAYLTNWTVVKARWELTVTPGEMDTLRRGITSQCP